jgi:type I restriction enzyme M protein
VLTYAPDAYVDEKKTQVGYEISFTKYFYKPIELREMKDIIESLNALEKEADGMMAEIMDTPILSIQLVTRQEMLMDIKS